MNIDQLLDERFRADFTDLHYRDRPRMIDRIVSEELHALATRRAAQHHHTTEEQPR